MQTKKRIILGSASPRRRELLEQIGISFEVRVSDKEEVYHSLIPEEIVKELALSKAENVADDLREKQEQVKQISFDKKNNVLLDTIVIGADTIVVSDGSILGKPKDEADAVRMIRSLQGRSHKVYTGVAI
ncbi:Maf family protein, partial [[Ruminococcus] torques]